MRVLDIQRAGRPERIVTFLEPDEIDRLGGVPPEAVVGILDGNGGLQVNGVFREFLHEAVAAVAPLDPEMQAAARVHPGGRFVYVDSRCPSEVVDVPLEDVIGWFSVRGGEVVPGSYQPNPEHKILNDSGYSEVIEVMRRAMVDELIIRSAAQRQGRSG